MSAPCQISVAQFHRSDSFPFREGPEKIRLLPFDDQTLVIFFGSDADKLLSKIFFFSPSIGVFTDDLSFVYLTLLAPEFGRGCEDSLMQGIQGWI
ncbi:hypothetical protein TNIN_441911 [Trichonephila inaurata madagascariensis]|uniref:Uncharacterized protein n=1 Tax=Trichonephila inaurata madagascariensis TaxID=2747483 RepID=A0A8X6XML2_9ARAC|nr:hypothetical protein TNIN_441911 [Trichonephila inaurata madagascariensis]